MGGFRRKEYSPDSNPTPNNVEKPPPVCNALHRDLNAGLDLYRRPDSGQDCFGNSAALLLNVEISALSLPRGMPRNPRTIHPMPAKTNVKATQPTMRPTACTKKLSTECGGLYRMIATTVNITQSTLSENATRRPPSNMLKLISPPDTAIPGECSRRACGEQARRQYR